jgi:FtsZ-interacting cell division protein ZipA
MDTLRLVLLILGALFIGGMLVYYWATSDKKIKLMRLFSWLNFSPSADKDVMSATTPPPEYDDEPDAEDIAALSGLTLPMIEPEVDVDALGPISALSEELGASGETFIIAFNVMARQGQRFHGLDILNAIREQGFVFGDMNLFHVYPDQPAKGAPMCSLANTVEPGSFDIEHMAELETPGLLLFMQLPGPLEGAVAFERLLQLGRALAEQLDGVLCDESRSVLTLQTIGHIKEKIEVFHFKQKMSSLNHHH